MEWKDAKDGLDRLSVTYPQWAPVYRAALLRVEELERQRDEARATKDMHKERAEEAWAEVERLKRKCDAVTAEAAKDSLLRKQAEAALADVLGFLRKSSIGRKEIVSTARLSALAIANHRAAGLMYVEPGGGLGWVVRESAPPWWQRDQDAALAAERATPQSLGAAVPDYWSEAKAKWPWLPETTERLDDEWRNRTRAENALWIIDQAQAALAAEREGKHFDHYEVVRSGGESGPQTHTLYGIRADGLRVVLDKLFLKDHDRALAEERERAERLREAGDVLARMIRAVMRDSGAGESVAALVWDAIAHPGAPSARQPQADAKKE